MMKFVRKIRSKIGKTKYAMAQILTQNGVKLSAMAITKYERSAKRMRLDVLCILRKISGESWESFGKNLDAEFYKDKE